MDTTTKPSAGAMRAANHIRVTMHAPERVWAEIIDRETGAGEMLVEIKNTLSMLDGLLRLGDLHVSDGVKSQILYREDALLRIFRKARGEHPAHTCVDRPHLPCEACGTVS